MLQCGSSRGRYRGWGFHANALTSPGVELAFALRAAVDLSSVIRPNAQGICMATTEGELRLSAAASSWRTPLVIIFCGCAIALLSFGPRSSVGFFVQPMSREFSWGRDVF